jgi:hypothetical protein
VSTDLGTSIRERLERRSSAAAGRERRALAILLIGPLTMFGGLLWAIAQPYRIVFLEREGKGVWDFVVQPPLLVGLVGLIFMVLIAPSLVEDLEREGDGPEG